MIRSFSLFAVLLVSCTVPDKASLKVMRDTRKLKKSPVILTAANHGKVTDDKLELRENNSFEYRSWVVGTQKVAIYAGIFDRNGDTLTLHFQMEHKRSSWTGNAVIDKASNTITMISMVRLSNTQLAIEGVK